MARPVCGRTITACRSLKREGHRIALVEAATSWQSAILPRHRFGAASEGRQGGGSGCAGCYTALSALELYAEAFEDAGRLDRLEAFASHLGPDFYGLPRNRGTVTLQRRAQAVPSELPFGETTLVPLRAGETLRWTLAN
jgi:dihydroorotase